MQQAGVEGLQALVAGVLQQVPVQLTGLGPLPVLTEILSHEEQLLAGVTEHEAYSLPSDCAKLVVALAGHFLQHGALQMYDLIVGENQDKVLTVGIGHAEGHLIVMILSGT